MQERPARSVNFGYLQDNAKPIVNQQKLYIFGSKAAICVRNVFD